MKIIASEYQLSHTIPIPTGEFNKAGKPKTKGKKARGFSSGSVELDRRQDFYREDAIGQVNKDERRIRDAHNLD